MERSRAVCRRYLGEDAGDDYPNETVDQPCVGLRIVAERITAWDSPAWHP